MLNGTLKMFTRLINWIGVEIGFKGDIKHMTKNCSPNLRILTMHFIKFNLQLKKDFKKKFFRVGWINKAGESQHVMDVHLEKLSVTTLTRQDMSR